MNHIGCYAGVCGEILRGNKHDLFLAGSCDVAARSCRNNSE